MFNLRGSDIEFNPVFFAYALLTHDNVTLFINATRLESEAFQSLLKDGVKLETYESVFESLLTIAGNKRVWVDESKCNGAILNCTNHTRTFTHASPVTFRKAIKNEAEMAHMRETHLKDAVALMSYLAWLEENVAAAEAKNEPIDEVVGADRLEAFRKEQEGFRGLSFETISASGPNGAIIHYAPKAGECLPITTKDLYLCDSGGQYLSGTTDVTRTVKFGPPTDYERECFTRVLKGHIALASAVFPPGTSGPFLDCLARGSLWRAGLDYRHGTGHGVGAFLNVHEGPHGISSTRRKNSVMETGLEPGMVVTNEPGYYEEGKFGIRIENVMVVRKAETAYHFGGTQFYTFDTISLVPLQKALIDTSLLTAAEREWINDFHRQCREAVGPRVQGDAKLAAWLEAATSPS